MLEHTTIVERSGITGAQAGGLMAVVGGFTFNQWLQIGGFLLALFSVLFQVWATWYFKTKHLKIAEARLASDLAEKDDEDNG